MVSFSLLTFHSLILFFSLFFFTISNSKTPTTKLTLTPTSLKSVFSDTELDTIQLLSTLAQSTISRAKHLKTRKSDNDHVKKTEKPSTQIPLQPRGYGGYSISLSFGTPPQASELVFDTGSSLVWVPCTSRYLCSRCNFPNVDPAKLPKFIPKSSSTSRLIGCADPMCSWIFGPDTSCRKKNSTDTGTGNSSTSASAACPAYVIQYGSGSTAGLLLSDTLDLPKRGPVPKFLFGCSVLSVRQPSGIAGFGRGPQSLPSQLKLSKFSYCLVSHRLDDTPASSDLILDGDASGGELGYTPFLKNPGEEGSPFREYYYVMLRRVFVGGRKVKIPYNFLRPSEKDGAGSGGTIVDSGSTFTFMEKAVHVAVAGEFSDQMKKFKRAGDVENRTGLSPCFDLSGEKSVEFPQLVFQFKGGAKMELPLPNYFSLVGGDVACLTVVTNGGPGPELSGGPAIILGNYQQMNFHVEYDLKNNRFGFRREICSK